MTTCSSDLHENTDDHRYLVALAVALHLLLRCCGHCSAPPRKYRSNCGGCCCCRESLHHLRFFFCFRRDVILGYNRINEKRNHIPIPTRFRLPNVFETVFNFSVSEKIDNTQRQCLIKTNCEFRLSVIRSIGRERKILPPRCPNNLFIIAFYS